MSEVWKDIPGTTGFYSVSNLGRARRNAKKFFSKTGYVQNHPERILKLHRHKFGYKTFFIHCNGIKKNVTIHRCVAICFLDNPENLPLVTHLDNNPENNNVDNLKWATEKENSQHMVRSGRNNPLSGERSNFSKLKERDVLEIRHLLKSCFTFKMIASAYNVTPATIGNINRGKTWVRT